MNSVEIKYKELKKLLIYRKANISMSGDTRIKQEVAYGVFKGFKSFWRCEEFSDFTIEIDGVHFQCHRVILAACSDFFSGLFRSGMQETEQKKVILKDISSETFELIMESVYTGHDVLRNDNVIDVWMTADQLQIQYLMSECEKFVLETLSMDNYAEYFYTANTLNSSATLERLRPFVLKNCISFFQTNYFFELPMNVMLSLIKSQDLETKSQDDVIDAILKWVESQCNREQMSDVMGVDSSCKPANYKEKNKASNGDRPISKKIKLCKDFSEVSSKVNRNDKLDSSDKENNLNNVKKNDTADLVCHCYAIQSYLEMLIRHPLVTESKRARDIVIKASLRQLHKVEINGQEPSRFAHKNDSPFLKCIVTAFSIGNLSWITFSSLAKGSSYSIDRFENCEKIKIAVVNNKVYAFYIFRSQNNTRHLSYDSRVHFCPAKIDICEAETALPLRSKDFSLAVVDSFVYIFSAQEKTVWKLDVNSRKLSEESSLPGHENIAYMMAYGYCIFVFYASTDKGVTETVVQCYDTLQNTWTEIDHLEGKADGMTTFEHDNFTYLLQSNGKLWKVVKPQSNIISFQLVAQLWSCDLSLHGAVTFLDDLRIVIQPTEDLLNDRQLIRSLPGVFREIYYLMLPFGDNLVFTPILLNENNYRDRQFIPISFVLKGENIRSLSLNNFKFV